VLWSFNELTLELAGRVMQPICTPGTRHSGLASATIETLVNNTSIATATETGKDKNESRRIV